MSFQGILVAMETCQFLSRHKTDFFGIMVFLIPVIIGMDLMYNTLYYSFKNGST